MLSAGHLGELTPLVPPGLVGEVLAATAAGQPGLAPREDGRVTVARERLLTARVMVYFTLAMALFGEVGYGKVWGKLTETVPAPVSGAFTRARLRIAAAPLAMLFARLAGASRAGAVCFGLRLVAVDGTHLAVADSAGNRAVLGKHRASHGTAGYPLTRVVALVECGTRAMIGAVFGPTSVGENAYAVTLLGDALGAGMLLLADRGFDAKKIIDTVVGAHADLLLRIKSTRRTTPVRRPFPDGSYLAAISGHVLRIIEAEVTLTAADGTSRTEVWRLATTVTHWRTAPALQIIECYHRRWEVETAFLGLKCTILRGRVLRSQSPALLDQEIWALLCVYQLITTSITLALAGTDTPREAGSFAEAVAARDQIIRAHGVLATGADILKVIGERVRHRLVDKRATRVGPRSVKRPLSKYAYKDRGVAMTTQKAVVHITIIELSPSDQGIP